MKKQIITGALLLLGTCGSVFPNDAIYSYSDLEKPLIRYGNQKSDTYDVAVHMTNLGLEGLQIKGINVPFLESEDITDIKVWLASELTLIDYQNSPDIISIAGSVENEVLSVEFPEPYLIPEQGVYVGYSFTVNEFNENTMGPVILGEGDSPEGFFFHTTKKYLKWTNMAERIGFVSAMSVIITGDKVPLDGGYIELAGDLMFDSHSEQFSIPLTYTFMGSRPVENLTFEYSYNSGKVLSSEVNFDPARDIQFTGVLPLALPVANEATLGVNNFKIRLSAINGSTLYNEEETIESSLYSFEFFPVKKTLVEEYAGLWCGYCPVGFAVSEYMEDNYPEDFICISYHSNDAMETLPYTDYPMLVNAYPTFTINRNWMGDPYYGKNGAGFQFLEDWQSSLTKFTPASIEISSLDYDALAAKINVETDVTFVINPENDCSVFYVLLGDGMQDKDWLQTNYYSGSSPFLYDLPGMEPFINGGTYIEGLVFNNVPIKNSDLLGVSGSLPASSEIEPNLSYETDYSFDLSDTLSGRGYDLLKLSKQIKVIVGVVDTVTGEVLNCAQAFVSGFGETSVQNINESIEEEYYTVSGTRINKEDLKSGIYIMIKEGMAKKIYIP